MQRALRPARPIGAAASRPGAMRSRAAGAADPRSLPHADAPAGPAGPLLLIEPGAQVATPARATAPATPRSASEPPAEGRDAPPGALVIVEDEPLLAMQLARGLDDLGWTVLGVAGSVDAAHRMMADLPRPDAAILDVDLAGTPVFPLARTMQRAHIPFIFCTGYDDVDFSPEFAGCTVVRKPATLTQIANALRRIVRGPAPGGALA